LRTPLRVTFLGICFSFLLALSGCQSAHKDHHGTKEERAQVIASYSEITSLFGDFKNVKADLEDAKEIKTFSSSRDTPGVWDEKTSYKSPEAVFQFVPSNENRGHWSRRISFKMYNMPKGNRNDLNKRTKNFIKGAEAKHKGAEHTGVGKLVEFKILKNKKAKKGITPETFAKFIFRSEKEGVPHHAFLIYTDRHLATSMMFEKKDEPITKDDVKGINEILLFYMNKAQKT